MNYRDILGKFFIIVRFMDVFNNIDVALIIQTS